MSEEQNEDKKKPEEESDSRKRRRTPSQYANQIADFKNVQPFASRTTPLYQKKIRTTNITNLNTTNISRPKPNLEENLVSFPPEEKFQSLLLLGQIDL